MNGFPSINKARKRNNVDSSTEPGAASTPDWAWCWPRNRRIIYNRAAVDLDGKPWDAEHPVLAWNGTTWVGDVVDGGGNPINLAADGGQNLPFIMNAEGVGKLWGYGLKDGPIPEVYEPWESPLDTNLMTAVANDRSPRTRAGLQRSGVIHRQLEGRRQGVERAGTVEEFPYVATTYRCTEHWQTGIMTRNLPWLAELMPEMYVEIGDGPGRRTGHRQRGQGQGQLQARVRFDALGSGHQASSGDNRGWQDHPSGRHTLALGLRRTGDRRQRQRSDSPRRGRQHQHTGIQELPVQG